MAYRRSKNRTPSSARADPERAPVTLSFFVSRGRPASGDTREVGDWNVTVEQTRRAAALGDDIVERVEEFASYMPAGYATTGVPDRPSDAEIDQAAATFVRLLAAEAGDEWRHAVDGLADSPSLDTDRLYQAQRHAALRRWVLDRVDLLAPARMAELLPDRVGTDSNVARVIDGLRERGELLGVRFKERWRYPSAQISRRGSVYDALPGLVARARTQGYEPWEIVYWLARPIEVRAPEHIGRPLAHDGAALSLDELFAAAGETAPAAAAAEAELGPSPFELLAADDEAAFDRAASDWLGQDADDTDDAHRPA